ncbi:MAG TPA: hypothetical protein VM867_00955, partial [Xanthobacteraceae bacterium]|nr:hypothetical protein [Xanthobacteraceae bacterium]
AYDKIPADLRKVFDEYFGPGGQPAWGKILETDEINNRALLAKEGVKFTALPDSELPQFMAIATKLQTAMIEDFEKKGLKAKAFFDILKQAAAAK